MTQQQVLTRIAIRALLIKHGIKIIDARIGAWRTGYHGLTVTQDKHATAQYIVITSRYPKGTGDQAIADACAVLAKAGIKASTTPYATIFINPLQCDQE